ncbi:Uncharacterised protein [Serratia quinivorans]|uniref:hypothetical protein n=1 Tax=Serratia quinivorans TaxID=137545 RepID=UPI00217B9209|nr:hypothetical protein [Serratia quinivorans]CAI1875216.1 Uncharacterised protein [Serratia quinivorans]CAI1899428.1 Uncharacterised protein [Serratia quinivorans]
MKQKNQSRAYLRGKSAAKIWKRIKVNLRSLDNKCVAKARSLKLPAWIGHIPMAILSLVMLLAIVFGGMIIASSAVFIGALILLVGGAFSPIEETLSDEDEMINTSYKSPNEYRADGEFGPGWYAGNYKVKDDY